MTELEKTLLSAFEALQSSYEQQQTQWQNERDALLLAQKTLQELFTKTTEQNNHLSGQVTNLTKLVMHLAEQVQQLK